MNKTFKFYMNSREWKIIEDTQLQIKEKNNKNDDDYYFGICDYREQIIYLDKDLCDEAKQQTLLHELMHCYLYCYYTNTDELYNEEVLCNVSANSHIVIDKIFKSYFDL